jgi:signal peptidase I
MSNRTPVGEQLPAINPWCPIVETSFSLTADDDFVIGQGIDYSHWKCLPSPIGLKDRGDYRRDGLDTITSNGMIYVCAGIFTACETDNVTDKKRTDGGVVDPSVSRLILPRFYNTVKSVGITVNTSPVDDGKRIYLAPGDRIYVSDPVANVKVSNYQKMTFENGPNIPMFPIIELEVPIIDSRNVQYNQGLDYCISADGNITWLPGGSNPGIDPETGKGRVYSVRYLYNAFHYIASLPKEVRMTNITAGGVRQPARMAYYATIQREYLYHSQNRSDPKNQTASKTPGRAVQAPLDTIKPGPAAISVDMINFVADGIEGTVPVQEDFLEQEKGGLFELDNQCGDLELEE